MRKFLPSLLVLAVFATLAFGWTFGQRFQARRAARHAPPPEAAQADPGPELHWLQPAQPRGDCPNFQAAVKEEAGQQGPVVYNYGLVRDKMGKMDGYMRNGKRVSRQECMEALALADDTGKLSLTFAGGTEQERQQAVTAAQQAGLAESCLVQAYAADNPLLKCGFVTDGHPSVYLQLPSGRVLLRRGDASPQSVEALRDAVAGYDKRKDPTGAAVSLDSVKGLLAKTPPWCYVAAGVCLLLLLRLRKAP